MKHIIHDWDDERALKILSNIRRVMKNNGRVMLVEAVITSGTEEPDFGKLIDIENACLAWRQGTHGRGVQRTVCASWAAFDAYRADKIAV